MKTIGLVGGMSWESTVPYYQLINRAVKERLGGLHSAKVVLVSVDFHEIEALLRPGLWDRLGEELVDAATRVEAAGAEGIVLGCTEIGMLLADGDLSAPVFDTTSLHATAAALLATEDAVASTASP